jgi:uncharacterized protein (DUF427 family)
MAMSKDDFSLRLKSSRDAWVHRGGERPDFARPPGEGQESVWDYPRPPALVGDVREVVVSLGGVEIARSRRSLRVLETASPPTFYLPPEDVRREFFKPATDSSFCEWKGQATYWDVDVRQAKEQRLAWSYPNPFRDAADLAGYFSFYPARADCWVDGEEVRAQVGGFYGGWVTDEIVGPFKGEPGTGGW